VAALIAVIPLFVIFALDDEPQSKNEIEFQEGEHGDLARDHTRKVKVIVEGKQSPKRNIRRTNRTSNPKNNRTTDKQQPGSKALDTNAIVSQFNRSGGRFRQCYRIADRSEDITVNSFSINIKVRPNGSVSRVRFSPNPSQKLGQCIRRVIKRWQLPPSRGGPYKTELKF